MARNVREYVLSCGWRRCKRSSSQQVVLLPARAVEPWEVLKKELLRIGWTSLSGNDYLLLAVDEASKFSFAFPLPSKKAVGDNPQRRRTRVRMQRGQTPLQVAKSRHPIRTTGISPRTGSNRAARRMGPGHFLWTLRGMTGPVGWVRLTGMLGQTNLTRPLLP